MESYEIRNLTFTYPGKASPALCDLNITIKEGQFLTLVGSSGCGKTTLLRRLKPSFAPHGEVSGEIDFEGAPIDMLEARTESSKIGFVMQSPDNQIVTDKVWHELAFGLESLGVDTASIRLRVAEMASFFGIQEWFHKSVTELSGGQKQLLSLASIMAMQPSVLILDEPTSQLDPIAASEFLATIGKINRELGVTVIMTEHRLEEVFPLSDKVIVMDSGRIIEEGTPAQIGMKLRGKGHGMFHAMPVPMRVYAAVDNSLDCPITVRDGRGWLRRMEIKSPQMQADEHARDDKMKPSVELDEVWFRYEKNTPDVVKGLSFKAYAGEVTAILGGNGTGKTTTLSLISAINKPYRGKVLVEGENPEKNHGLFNGVLGVLPQNPQALFVRKTVEEDLLEMFSGIKISKTEMHERIRSVVSICRLRSLLQSHPYDLSGGEQQRTALAKVLLLKPRILLLDEPTKGLDAEFKLVFASILRELAASGVTIIMVSHDIEFCAEHAHRCAMFFDGSIVSVSTPREFFSGNSFYTSSANRMARQILPEAITAADIIRALGGESNAAPDVGEYRTNDSATLYSEQTEKAKPVLKAEYKLELWRKIMMCAAGVVFLIGIAMIALNFSELKVLISGGEEAIIAAGNSIGILNGIVILVIFILSGILWAFARKDDPGFELQVASDKRKLPKRTAVAAAMILIAIPLTIYMGIFFLHDRKYHFISTLVILETMIPFALIFESRKPQARELVIIAVLCGIGVAGRAAFFMLPQFKPVVAVAIISGVAFGGETGFLVGAMTGLVSNMFFGQGPHTPWQMFAFGIIGFLAGVLFRKGVLRRSRAALCIFGGLSTFVIFGVIMNSSALFTYQQTITKEMFWLYILQGVPFDLIHALATVFFLAVTSRAMLEKLDRVKLKFGLIE